MAPATLLRSSASPPRSSSSMEENNKMTAIASKEKDKKAVVFVEPQNQPSFDQQQQQQEEEESEPRQDDVANPQNQQQQLEQQHQHQQQQPANTVMESRTLSLIRKKSESEERFRKLLANMSDTPNAFVSGIELLKQEIVQDVKDPQSISPTPTSTTTNNNKNHKRNPSNMSFSAAATNGTNSTVTSLNNFTVNTNTNITTAPSPPLPSAFLEYNNNDRVPTTIVTMQPLNDVITNNTSNQDIIINDRLNSPTPSHFQILHHSLPLSPLMEEQPPPTLPFRFKKKKPTKKKKKKRKEVLMLEYDDQHQFNEQLNQQHDPNHNDDFSTLSGASNNNRNDHPFHDHNLHTQHDAQHHNHALHRRLDMEIASDSSDDQQQSFPTSEVIIQELDQSDLIHFENSDTPQHAGDSAQQDHQPTKQFDRHHPPLSGEDSLLSYPQSSSTISTTRMPPLSNQSVPTQLQSLSLHPSSDMDEQIFSFGTQDSLFLVDNDTSNARQQRRKERRGTGSSSLDQDHLIEANRHSLDHDPHQYHDPNKNHHSSASKKNIVELFHPSPGSSPPLSTIVQSHYAKQKHDTLAHGGNVAIDFKAITPVVSNRYGESTTTTLQISKRNDDDIPYQLHLQNSSDETHLVQKHARIQAMSSQEQSLNSQQGQQPTADQASHVHHQIPRAPSLQNQEKMPQQHDSSHSDNNSKEGKRFGLQFLVGKSLSWNSNHQKRDSNHEKNVPVRTSRSTKRRHRVTTTSAVATVAPPHPDLTPSTQKSSTAGIEIISSSGSGDGGRGSSDFHALVPSNEGTQMIAMNGDNHAAAAVGMNQTPQSGFSAFQSVVQPKASRAVTLLLDPDMEPTGIHKMPDGVSLPSHGTTPAAHLADERESSVDGFEFDSPLLQQEILRGKAKAQRIFCLILCMLMCAAIGIIIGIFAPDRYGRGVFAGRGEDDSLSDLGKNQSGKIGPDLNTTNNITMSAVPSGAPTQSPGFTTQDILVLIQARVPESANALLFAGTPQQQAFSWLIKSNSASDFFNDRNRILQRYALATFYFSLDGSDWPNQHRWLNRDEHECDWFPSFKKPSCNDEGRLTDLTLSSNRLHGILPEDISLLTHLVSMDLSENTILRSLPSGISKLSKLESLQLDSNSLSGTIPRMFGLLTNLKTLSLYLNKFTGVLPIELSRLTNLKTMSFSANNLTGTIPFELGRLNSLQDLDLKSNNLWGAWPLQLMRLSNLQNLDVSNNNFCTSIPTEFGRLKQLKRLSLDRSGIKGTLPPELGQMMKLEYMSLSHNNITGTLPTELGQLTELIWMDVSHNALYGPLPSELAQITGLQILHVESNRLNGTIPTEFGQLRSYQSEFHLSENSFEGSLSPAFCSATCCAGGIIRVDETKVQPCSDVCFGCDNIFSPARIFPTNSLLRGQRHHHHHHDSNQTTRRNLRR